MTSTENIQKLITKLLQEDFIMLHCGKTYFFYDKKGKLFLLNPFKHSLENKTDSDCDFRSEDMNKIWSDCGEYINFENPMSNYYYRDFDFLKLRSFFRSYDEDTSQNPVFQDGTRLYWALGKNYWSVDTETGIPTKKEDSFISSNLDINFRKFNPLAGDPFCWPSFEIQDSLDDVDNWLTVLRKYKMILSCIEDEKYKKAFLKRHADFNADILDKAYSELKELEEISDDVFDKVVNNPQKMDLIEELCNCDLIRAGIQSYDEKWLRNPNKGHWELTEQICKKHPGLCPGHPKDDVHKYGIVGIDFGTKSTVVVYQSGDNNIHQICVGKTDFNQELEASDYENPTIIELISYDNFVEAYKKKGGRPKTQWKDLKVSYGAQKDLDFSSNSGVDEKTYLSFFSDLKRWADSSSDKPHFFKDKKKTIKLLPYKILTHGLEDDEFDPIEIYAYYLGLYINNMRNGIFLDYYLSFPVTYSESVRHHIAQSFERGLKKSLPNAVLTDKKLMERFSINTNISEPAAYAVCAMQEYGFQPEENKNIYFGIFDFGGGTADFDFGSWSESQISRYDYKIINFGAAGDKYLGGENLLELAAFNIFKNNLNILREDGIKFKLPQQCQKFMGCEIVVDDSPEADYNMKSLMERIRPIWEGTLEDSDRDTLDRDGISPMLIPSTGSIKSFNLTCSFQEIEDIFKNRIREGIDKFLASFKEAWDQFRPRPEKFYILLAGNSSKSPLVKELFEERIDEFTNKWPDLDKQIFEILPPIGTEDFEDSRKRLFKEGIVADPKDKETDETEHPTGKTGVAFGLLIARKGGRIEIENAAKEIPFKYYVGTEKRGKFKMLNKDLLRDNKLPIGGLWCEFYDLIEGDTEAELFFTSDPKAANGDLPINSAKKVVCRFPEVKTEGKKLYIRAKDSDKIEYTIEEGRCLGEIRLSETNN